MVDDGGEVALAAAVADLVDADRDQPLQPALVEVVGDDALDDPPDRVPADPQQPGDRRLGHLLRQPRDDVFEVARVVRAGPRPRDRLELHAAVRAAQPAQLALDHAPARAEIQMAPALDAPVVDLQMPAGLPAARAHPPPAPQPDGHDHPLGAEADVDDRRAGQAQQPVECRGDAHVVLLAGRLTFEQPAACAEGGGASLAFCATSEEILSRESPAHAANAARPSPPTRPETQTSRCRNPDRVLGVNQREMLNPVAAGA